MKIELAKSAGFCFGVERAVKTVRALIEENDGARLYTLGCLIHNPHVTAELSRGGVTVLSDEAELQAALNAAKGGKKTVLVIRTHGIAQAQEQHLRLVQKSAPSLSVVDCTCPFVKKIHRIAKEESAPFSEHPEEALGLIFGDERHPEVEGIRSYFSCRSEVFADFASFEAYLTANAEALAQKKRLILVSQTTQSLSEYKKCQKKLKKLYTNANIFDTICSVTEDRQTETAALSKCWMNPSKL